MGEYELIWFVNNIYTESVQIPEQELIFNSVDNLLI